MSEDFDPSMFFKLIVESGPYGDRWEPSGKECNSWECILTLADDVAWQGLRKRAMAVTYRMGLAIDREPDLSYVLGSVLMDTMGVMGEGLTVPFVRFEDWAPDYGYDPDSRSAERLYDTVVEQAEDFMTLFEQLGRDVVETVTPQLIEWASEL